MVSGNSFVVDRDHEEKLVAAATSGDRPSVQLRLIEEKSLEEGRSDETPPTTCPGLN